MILIILILFTEWGVDIWIKVYTHNNEVLNEFIFCIYAIVFKYFTDILLKYAMRGNWNIIEYRKNVTKS